MAEGVLSSPPYTLDLRRGALGTAALPGSKSLSNRVLLLSALAERAPPRSMGCSHPMTPR